MIPRRSSSVAGEFALELSDRQLLERFVGNNDNVAFRDLLDRHGKTVWGVCRRILQRDHDAEDAFQAVFLILVRRADSIRKGEAVASWLYGVAYRTAMRARAQLARRHTIECQAETRAPAPPSSEASTRELQRVLDEEVASLPAKYRAPFVLCCLEGMSRARAARELGWPKGSVSSRIAQARALLEKRLARRGITLSAALTLATLSANSAAAGAVPATLVQATAAAVAGNAPAAAALALAESMLPGLGLNWHALVAGLLLCATAALLVALQPPADTPAAAAEAVQPGPWALLAPVDDRVAGLSFSPDGQRLATAGGDWNLPGGGQLTVWDVPGRKELFSLRGIPPARAIVFSPNGKFLVTGGVAPVKLLDSQTGAVLATGDDSVNRISFAPDGATFVTGGMRDHVVRIWETPELRIRQELRGHTKSVFAVAHFHHGPAVVSGSADGSAKVWDLAAGKERLNLKHGWAVEGVAVSPDDRLVATGGWEQLIRLWDANTGELRALINRKGEGNTMALAFSPDGRILATGSAVGSAAAGHKTPCKIYLWEVATQRLIKSLPPHRASIWQLAFSPDGSLLASASYDKTARVWDMTHDKEVASFVTTAPPPQPIRALAISPSKEEMAVAVGDDGALELRGTREREVRQVLRGHTGTVTCLAFAPDGQSLASGSKDESVRIWDLAHGQPVRTWSHAGGVQALAFAPDGKRLASAGDDGLVVVRDPGSGKVMSTLMGHSAGVRALAFSSDGLVLASGGADRTVKVWDLASSAERLSLPGHGGTVRALSFASPSTLASGSEDTTIKLWDLSQGKERHSLRGSGEVWAMAITPSGHTLIAGGADTALRVWDVASGQLRATMQKHQEPVTTIAVNAQGRALFSGGLDGTVLRWGVVQGDAALAVMAPRDGTPPTGSATSGQRRWLRSALILASFLLLGLGACIWLRLRKK